MRNNCPPQDCSQVLTSDQGEMDIGWSSDESKAGSVSESGQIKGNSSAIESDVKLDNLTELHPEKNMDIPNVISDLHPIDINSNNTPNVSNINSPSIPDTNSLMALDGNESMVLNDIVSPVLDGGISVDLDESTAVDLIVNNTIASNGNVSINMNANTLPVLHEATSSSLDINTPIGLDDSSPVNLDSNSQNDLNVNSSISLGTNYPVILDENTPIILDPMTSTSLNSYRSMDSDENHTVTLDESIPVNMNKDIDVPIRSDKDIIIELDADRTKALPDPSPILNCNTVIRLEGISSSTSKRDSLFVSNNDNLLDANVTTDNEPQTSASKNFSSNLVPQSQPILSENASVTEPELVGNADSFPDTINSFITAANTNDTDIPIITPHTITPTLTEAQLLQFVPKRSVRTRTALQLAPYSLERQKYKTQLLRNGWPDVAKERDRVAIALDRAEALNPTYSGLVSLGGRIENQRQKPKPAAIREQEIEYFPPEVELVIPGPSNSSRPVDSPATDLKRKKRTVHIYSSDSGTHESVSSSSSIASRNAISPVRIQVKRNKKRIVRSHSHISVSSASASESASTSASASPHNVPNKYLSDHSDQSSTPFIGTEIVDDLPLPPNHTRSKPGKKYKLDKTRAKMLGHTMPGLFHKRAEQDLRLLEKENTIAQQRRSERKEMKRRKKQVNLEEILQEVDEGGESDDRDEVHMTGKNTDHVQRDAIDIMLTSNKNWKPKRRKTEMDGIADWVMWRRKNAGAGKEVDEGWDDSDANSDQSKLPKERSFRETGRNSTAVAIPSRKNTIAKTLISDLFPVIKAGHSSRFISSKLDIKKKFSASEKSARSNRKNTSHISGPITRNDKSASLNHQDRVTDDVGIVDITQLKLTNEWSKAGIVSADFGIEPLPVGISFEETSDISKGRIWELVHSEAGTNTSVKQFDGLVQAEDMAAIWDEMYEHLTNSSDSNSSLQILMRRLCLSASSETLCVDAGIGMDEWQSSILEGLDHIYERLQAQELSIQIPIEFDWFAVEICYRLEKVNGLEDDAYQGAYSQAFKRLVIRLLESGVQNVINHIKERSSSYLTDVHLQLWIALIHISNHGVQSGSFFRKFCPIFQDYVQSYHQNQPLMICETSFYMAFALSQISQFSLTGVSMTKPFLTQDWSLIISSMANINLVSNSEVDAAASAMAISVRDRYIWSIFARCLNLASFWNWSVGTDVDSILTPLFEILNSRKLLGLKRERTPDFPLFIRKYDVTLADTLDQAHDTAVDIFLKLLKKACVESEKDQKPLSRFLSRISPVRRIPFTVKDPPTTRDISILFNHYSFELQLLLLLPSSCKQWLAQARNFLAFSTADFRSRQVCIRAMMYFGVLHRHHSISLKPIASWFADMSNLLVQEIEGVSKDEKKGIAAAGSKLNQSELEKRGLMDDEYARSLPRRRSELRIQLLMVLRSIQHVIHNCSLDPQRSKEKKFPDMELLHDSWIKGILQSNLARDVEIGVEVLTCIQAILSARLASLPANVLHLANSESQDEFGAMDIDFNDPSLLVLLGASSEPVKDVFDFHAADLQLAEIIKSDIAPTVSTLLSNLFVQDPVTVGQNKISDEDKSKYIDTVIDTWAACAHILISHNIKTWESYFSPFGAESWRRRFANRRSRQKVGIRFCNALLSLDSKIYNSIKSYIFDMLMECLVSHVMTSDQTQFCNYILKCNFLIEEDGSPLLATVPEYFAAHLIEDGGLIQFHQITHRLQLVRAIFQNSERILQSEESSAKAQQNKSMAYECIRGALCSMQDVYENLETSDKEDYLVVSLAIIQILQESIGHRHLACMKELSYFEKLNQDLINKEQNQSIHMMEHQIA